MGPEALAQVLRPLEGYFDPEDHPHLLVGLGVSDDAAVYRLDKGRALVQTIDFFPPIIDDPRDFGAVAAANAMSDVYAMGGEVALALNVCCFPDDLPPHTLQEILLGGAEKVKEAGGVIAGGHTVTDAELKYGLSVMGLVDPRKIHTKAGARPGDLLFLTKPLGTGITTTALKNKRLREADIAATVDSMKTLNRAASALLRGFATHGCTDVTGFSLLGHGMEMAVKSGVGLRLSAGAVPFLEHAESCAAARSFPGGTFRNQRYYAAKVHFDAGVGDLRQLMLFSPETSGGLLAAVDPADGEALLAASRRQGVPCWRIGEVLRGQGIRVTP
jgi:selenide,water dikinase